MVCLQGASAIQQVLQELAGKPVRAFIVWEPVLFTDWVAPSTVTLERVGDSRTIQFWDRNRLISHILGEHDRRSIVWDHVAVYPAGAVWNQQPPQPVYEDGPVVGVAKPLRNAVISALAAR
jgi:hypothetical protein